jgi:outer membrane lipopolysaccharide assembly protein LptE/RlpB
LKNKKQIRHKEQGSGLFYPGIKKTCLLISCTLFLVPFFTGCFYKFNDVSVPAEIKTIKILTFDNKARYQNNRLSPQLTERLRQKIVSQTKLTQVNNENADWEISGFISQYDVTTSAISNQQVATNRLIVGVSITVTDRKTGKEPKNLSVNRSFDFSATLTLNQAEQRLNDEMIRNLADEIFNQIFSDWK